MDFKLIWSPPLPGKRITRHQESLYMSKRKQGESQETAAAKAAISERSGRRIEKGERQPMPGERHWRTREDPLEAVWEKELMPLVRKRTATNGLNPLGISGRRTCRAISLPCIANPSTSRQTLESHARAR